MNDWISYVIHLQPQARELEESMRFREYELAKVIAKQIVDDMLNLRMWIIDKEASMKPVEATNHDGLYNGIGKDEIAPYSVSHGHPSQHNKTVDTIETQ